MLSVGGVVIVSYVLAFVCVVALCCGFDSVSVGCAVGLFGFAVCGLSWWLLVWCFGYCFWVYSFGLPLLLVAWVVMCFGCCLWVCCLVVLLVLVVVVCGLLCCFDLLSLLDGCLLVLWWHFLAIAFWC